MHAVFLARAKKCAGLPCRRRSLPTFQVNKQIAAIVEKVTGVPSSVTQKIADRVSESGVLDPKNLQQQVNAARMIGKMAVQFGSQKLASKLQDLSTSVAASSTPQTKPQEMPTLSTDMPTEGNTDDAGVSTQSDASKLPIGDYQSRTALDIIAQLGGLNAEQLAQVAAFESGNRARRTILAKITQLLAH